MAAACAPRLCCAAPAANGPPLSRPPPGPALCHAPASAAVVRCRPTPSLYAYAASPSGLRLRPPYPKLAQGLGSVLVQHTPRAYHHRPHIFDLPASCLRVAPPPAACTSPVSSPRPRPPRPPRRKLHQLYVPYTRPARSRRREHPQPRAPRPALCVASASRACPPPASQGASSLGPCASQFREICPNYRAAELRWFGKETVRTRYIIGMSHFFVTFVCNGCDRAHVYNGNNSAAELFIEFRKEFFEGKIRLRPLPLGDPVICANLCEEIPGNSGTVDDSYPRIHKGGGLAAVYACALSA